MRRMIAVLIIALSGATIATANGAVEPGVQPPSVERDVVTVAGSYPVALKNECSKDSDCSDPQKPNCCCGLTATGATVCTCQPSCQ